MMPIEDYALVAILALALVDTFFWVATLYNLYQTRRNILAIVDSIRPLLPLGARGVADAVGGLMGKRFSSKVETTKNGKFFLRAEDGSTRFISRARADALRSGSDPSTSAVAEGSDPILRSPQVAEGPSGEGGEPDLNALARSLGYTPGQVASLVSAYLPEGVIPSPEISEPGSPPVVERPSGLQGLMGLAAQVQSGKLKGSDALMAALPLLAQGGRTGPSSGGGDAGNGSSW